MIKQILYFGNPSYLNLKDKQLHIHIKNVDGEEQVTRSIEDIGVVILDHSQITISHNAIKALQDNKVAIISCDDRHMPQGLMLPIEGHTEQSERFRNHLAASVPLKKNLWQQTVVAKISNQMKVLDRLGKPTKRLEVLVKRVQSGDPSNVEAQAAAYYWPTLIDGFIRDRYGEPPNNLLNYGYAILRAMVARALVSSGLILTLGIHHKNKYNAYCLADDVMEPFRPFVDLLVYNMFINKGLESFLLKESKRHLLSLGQVDALFGKQKRPLLVGLSHTTASLYKCFAGQKRKIVFPLML
jgi:CRISPR-associated protein Cas1